MPALVSAYSLVVAPTMNVEVEASASPDRNNLPQHRPTCERGRQPSREKE
jgi:hypothetical protein